VAVHCEKRSRVIVCLDTDERKLKVEDFAALDMCRYRLRLRALEDASLPAFLGSTLRGAFGHALKRAVCVMRKRDCEQCLVGDRCLYPYLFETPPGASHLLRGQIRAPHPFILDTHFVNPFRNVDRAFERNDDQVEREAVAIVAGLPLQ